MKRVDYDEHQHRSYHEGRRYSPQVLDLWMRTVAEHAPSQVRQILDLGSGTGRFSPGLAERFSARVVGVEPSQKMRSVAKEKSPHPSVSYVAGEAASLPCEDSSIDLAFMSMVIHHVPDRGGAAAELARVVRPGGRLFLRTCFGDRLKGLPLYRYFPACKAVDAERMPTVAAVEREMGVRGFRRAAFVTVTQVIDETLEDHHDRLRRGAISTFELISKEDLEDGFARLLSAARQPDAPRPVTEDIDLLVLERDDS